MFLRNSRGALTPSNIHRTFSVRLIRFTAKYKEKSGSQPLQETKGLRIKFAGNKRKRQKAIRGGSLLL